MFEFVIQLFLEIMSVVFRICVDIGWAIYDLFFANKVEKKDMSIGLKIGLGILGPLVIATLLIGLIFIILYIG